MKTLYLRIALTTILVIILSSIIAFFFSNIYYQYNLKAYNDQKVTRMADDMVSFYEKHPKINIEDYLENIGKLGYQIYLVDENHKGKFFGGGFRDQSLDDQIIEQVVNGKVYHGIADFPRKIFVTGFFDNMLTNSIGMKIMVNEEPHALFVRPDIEQQFGELRIFFALILGFAILLSILLVLVSTRYLVKPIVSLTEATKKIGKGNYNIQLNTNRRDEIGALAKHFTDMATNLEQLEEMRQEFVSNVSHEIQSPLSAIQGFSQTLQTENLSEEERQYYLSIIEKESRRMSQLSKQLLVLASLDKEEHILNKHTYDLALQIKQVFRMTEWQWHEKNIMVDLKLPHSPIYADETLLHQVWVNLITNSIKFTDEGGTIFVNIKKMENEYHIKIQDNGIGISKEDLPQIFNRFYKADKARQRTEGSSGLGLAITKKIIELHRGVIYVESTLGKGTTFYIQIPIK